MSPTRQDEKSLRTSGPDGGGAWERLCPEDDLWDGEMSLQCLSDGTPVLLVNVGGRIRAYQGTCPHQQSSLADADLYDGVITCPAHLWEFDAHTGSGINPATEQLAEYAADVRDGHVYVRPPQPANRKAMQK